MHLKTKITKPVVVVSVIIVAILVAITFNLVNNRKQDYTANLTELNNSGVSGNAKVSASKNGHADFEIKANGLVNEPHLQHIHYGDQARNECPDLTEDSDSDGLLLTSDGQLAYGPVLTSLTTVGDTTPASVLAFDRSPTYSDNQSYKRSIKLSQEQLQPILDERAVVVIHGIDSILKDGKYSGDKRSELNANIPEEATAPAACGVLKLKNSSAHKY